MAAGFGWIDFSDEQREKVYAVIDLLDAGGTVDELGIGIVRDALADWMFPGVSTIQTRPKYFLILPEILSNYQKQYLEGKKIPALADYFDEEENRIMKLLAENYNYKEGHGVIGITKAKENKELARKASSVYWNGLRIHGLIKTQLSRAEYVKANDLSEYEDDAETLNNYEDYFGLKTFNLKILDEDMTMDLNREEAIFLRDQFLDTNSDSDKKKHNLLSEILKEKSRVDIVNSAANFIDAATVLLEDPDLPRETTDIVKIALDFDLLIHGALIRYNIQLHKKAGNLEFQQRLQLEWEAWLEEIDSVKHSLTQFDFDEVFTCIAKRVKPITQQFMRNWKEEVLKNERDVALLDQLVYNQEVHKKGSKAKLKLKDAAYDDWVGIGALGYRFNNVKNITKDLEIAYA